jgi:hypothetical protein
MRRTHGNNNAALQRRQMVMRAQENKKLVEKNEANSAVNIQAKPEINEAGDEYEKQADAIAEKVTSEFGGGSDEVTPEEQARLKREFEIYAEYKLKLMQLGIDAEPDLKKKKDLKEKRDEFNDKQKGFSDKRDDEKNWGSNEYKRKLKNRFEDYGTVINLKKASIVTSISNSVTELTLKLNNAISVLDPLVTQEITDKGEAQTILDTAKNDLSSAKLARENAAKTLSPDNTEENVILTQYDSIISSYELLIAELEKNIAGVGIDISSFQNIPSLLNEQKTQLEAIKKKVDNETDVAKLVDIQEKDFPDLKTSIENTIKTANPGRKTQAIDKDAKTKDLQDLKDKTTALEPKVTEIKEKKQSNTTDPASLTEEQILVLTAVVLGEGGSDYSMREIVWVYINNIRRKGFEGAMKTSSTYSKNGPSAKVAVHQESFKSWMVTLGAGEEYPGVKSRSLGDAQRLLKYIREEVLAHLDDNPIPDFTSQGYWGDLNNQKEKGDHWHQARQYLYLWKQAKVTGELMVIIGSGIKTSFLFDSRGIQRYFIEHPDQLPVKRSDIPQILPENNDYNKLKIGIYDVKAE